jgi:hypothetical protein
MSDDAGRLSFRLQMQPEASTVRFSGEIDERAGAGLADLAPQLAGSVVFHFGSVRRINSAGVLAWLKFVRDLPAVSDLTYTHCSPAVVMQLNMIRDFRAGAKVVSFFAPYLCEHCGREEDRLIEVTQPPWRTAETLPEFACAQCKVPLQLDDLPEAYLSFLRRDA